MNCFVIMPFSREFDDVYLAIKTCIEEKKNPLMLTEPEDKLLKCLLEKSEKELLEILHALHAERML